MNRFRAVLALALGAVGCAPSTERAGAAPDYLYVWAWARDTTRGSVLAVFDLAPGTPNESRLVALFLRKRQWPDGFRGAAVPHGIIFSRR